jgi:hypothetical protein
MIMLEQISIDFAIFSGNPFLLMGVDAPSYCQKTYFKMSEISKRIEVYFHILYACTQSVVKKY